MTAALFARAPRVLILVVVALLATTALALAAQGTVTAPPATEQAAVPERPTVVVPDVRGQVYVFAKGSLEQAGFAWKVEGSVRGYAANVVVSQTPAPGAKVYVDGSPLITLALKQSGTYKQQGMPEDASPYAGTAARLVGAVVAKPKPKVKTQATAAGSAPKVAAPVRVKKTRAAKAPTTRNPGKRTPAFTAPGAPAEPADEITLTARAAKLKRYIASHPTPTSRRVNHWLYQHNWIVTGARFGWSDGTGALRRLIEADELAQKLWGVGARSERVARRSLAEVQARTK